MGGRARAERASAPVVARAGERHADAAAVVQRLPLDAGNRAVSAYVQRLVVQREERKAALTWLRSLLRGDEGVDAAALGKALARLKGWSTDRQVHLITMARAEVDAFEAMIVAQWTEPAGGELVGLLEGARSEAALGQRLVDVFKASAEPSLGLVLVHNLPRARVMAALTGRADARAAITALLARNPSAGTHLRLGQARAAISELGDQLADPTKAGAKAVTPGMEDQVEKLLTPPAVAQARADAIKAGKPPPAFEPKDYLGHLMVALHATMQDLWPQSEAEDKRKPMDTSEGGHVEGIAAEAKARVDAIFGPFGSGPAPALTFKAKTLNDQTARPGDPFDMARYFVNDMGGDAVSKVKEDHHAFEDATAAGKIGDRVIALYAGTEAPSTAEETKALDGLGMATAERVRRLKVIDRMWPGLASGGRVFITAREGSTKAKTRARYWGIFKTMLHEYLHTTESKPFKDWYKKLDDPHHQITYQEGMTDLFTLYTWQSVFPNEVASNAAFRRKIQGTDDLDMAAVGGEPSHYPELDEARQLESVVGLANMRMARFQGRTDLLAAKKLPHS